MPYPSEHAARITNPNKYKKFARQNDKLGSGIDAIFGVLPDGKTELQAVRFDEKKFSVAEAKKWLADSKMKPVSFEPAKKESMNNSLAHITCNLCGLVRNETLEGRDHIVVPMVMMVEGVLNGSQGPLYYPKEELAKTPVVWNGRPIVVYHPNMNGEACSAAMPEVFNANKVGVIMNTRYESGALKAEAWLDKDKLNKVDSRILGNIQSGKITEVSTGVFTDNEMNPGDWKGRAYNGIARNYRPDHLAILPDQVGACSVADGAGLLRNQQQSFNDIREAIRAALNPQESMKPQAVSAPQAYRCIQDVYPDGTVIYEEGGVYYQNDYTIDEKTGAVTLGATPQEVMEKKEWVPVENMESDLLTNGGAGSGNFGHSGIPGQVGGSGPGGSGSSDKTKPSSVLGKKPIGAIKAAGFKVGDDGSLELDEKNLTEYTVIGSHTNPDKSKTYIVDKWHDEAKRTPQLIPDMFVREVKMHSVKNVKHTNNAKNCSRPSGVGSPFVMNKENKMDKKALVDGLIANSDGKFSEEDREKLMNTDETILNKMVPSEEPKKEEEAPAPAKTEELPAANADAQKPATLEEFVTNAPAEIRDVLIEGVRAHAAEKATLITAITANKANAFPKEMLVTKPIGELRAIAALAAPAKPAQSTPLFSGMAPVAEPTTNAAKQEGLAAPKWDFSKK